MKLTNNSRHWHRMWSVRLWTLAVILAGLEPALPNWEGVLPEWAHAALVSIVGMAGIIARFVPQRDVDHD